MKVGSSNHFMDYIRLRPNNHNNNNNNNKSKVIKHDQILTPTQISIPVVELNQIMLAFSFQCFQK
jgi:hypothetical protein